MNLDFDDPNLFKLTLNTYMRGETLTAPGAVDKVLSSGRSLIDFEKYITAASKKCEGDQIGQERLDVLRQITVMMSGSKEQERGGIKRIQELADSELPNKMPRIETRDVSWQDLPSETVFHIAHFLDTKSPH